MRVDHVGHRSAGRLAGGGGGLRVIDLNTYTQVGQYSTLRSMMFPPPDLGVYSVHHAVAEGNRAYVAWNADGLRVFDLSDPAAPPRSATSCSRLRRSERGTADQDAVVGVAVTPQHIVMTDVDFETYVLEKP